jgi:hypothetical protein
MGVARKVAILARECGLPLELSCLCNSPLFHHPKALNVNTQRG